MATTAPTYTETNETRLIFQLSRDDETKDRTIALPGVPNPSTGYADMIAAFNTFAAKMTTTNNQFVQPASWRDDTGSTLSTDEDPWTTTGLSIEFYTVQKTRYGYEAD